jgi:hypothetical protein
MVKLDNFFGCFWFWPFLVLFWLFFGLYGSYTFFIQIWVSKSSNFPTDHQSLSQAIYFRGCWCLPFGCPPEIIFKLEIYQNSRQRCCYFKSAYLWSVYRVTQLTACLRDLAHHFKTCLYFFELSKFKRPLHGWRLAYLPMAILRKKLTFQSLLQSQIR